MKFENYMILEFPSKSTNEAFARSAVSCFAAQMDPTIEELGDIRTAVSEAVTNCIVHAYPKELGEYSDAEFYALVNGGTRASVPAERTSAGFEGTLSIPASDGDYMYVDGYVSWNEDGQTVTEKIFGWDLWMSDMRMTLGGAGMHYIHNDADGKTVVSPYVDVITSELYPETYPAKALFEIYVSSELKASVGMPCEFEDGLVHCRLSPEEEVVLDGVFPPEELSMRVTVTDRSGNEFVKNWIWADEAK